MLPMMRQSESPLNLLHRDIDRIFDRAWDQANEWGYARSSYPVDIREDDNSMIVEAELPGFTKDQIEVTMEQGVLTISAQRKGHEEKQEGQWHLSERRFNRVQRSFRLPTPVDEDNVDCHLDNGLLTVTLPKREEVKPRKIAVK